MLQDLDDLLPKTAGSDRCKIVRFMETLEEADRKILDEALADTFKWSTHGLHVALRQKGIDIGYQTIYRHRKMTCSCGNKNA